MANTPTVYVICDQNCKFEGMTKEQILAAIEQAVSTGEIKDVDAGFISAVKTINGQTLRFFVGEQAAYDELSDEMKKNLFAIITNDVTLEGIREAIAELKQSTDNKFNSLETAIKDGTMVAGKSKILAITFKNSFTYSNKMYDADGNFIGTGGTRLDLTQGKTYLFINTTLGLTFTLYVNETTQKSFSTMCTDDTYEYNLLYVHNSGGVSYIVFRGRSKSATEGVGFIEEGHPANGSEFIYTEIFER